MRPEPPENHFTHIKPTFTENFQRLRQIRSDEVFFSGPDANGVWVNRSFSEFLSDIDKTCDGFDRHSTDKGLAVLTAAGNSYEHLVTIASALCSGRTLGLIDPGDPIDVIQSKVKQIGLDYIGYSEDEKILSRLPCFKKEFRSHGSEREFYGQFSENRPAILVFTSGSTGYSKIVQQPEKAILANVESVIHHHDLTEPTTIGTPLPVFHVNALEFSFLGSLFSGNRLVLLPSFSPESFLSIAEKHRINIASVVPHILKALHSRNLWDNYNLSSLRYFLTAASALSPSLAASLLEECPIPVIQGYGLSEAMNFSSTLPIHLSRNQRKKWLTEFERPSIGIALKGSEIEVLSPSGEKLGEGQKGEIVVRGLSLMTGYKDSDNSKVFEGGYLHTGDLGHFILDEDSGQRFYFIAGRIKETIKRYGSTISLVQVDDLLAKFPATNMAIAVGFQHEISGEELAVVAEVNKSFAKQDLASLLDFINETFPESIRPKILVCTQDSTRTTSGKPKRWKFASRLEKWKETVLGKKCANLGEI